MWQWILLFIVLTPGVLFTIPPYGKKLAGGLSGKVVTAILHGVVFAAAAWFFMLCKEGFEGFQDSGVRCPEGYGCTVKVQVCPAGTMGDPGRTSFTNNETLGNADINCTPCPSGTFSVPGSYRCESCPSGQLPNSSKTACESCPSGQVPNSSGTGCVTIPTVTNSTSGSGGGLMGNLLSLVSSSGTGTGATCASGTGAIKTGSTWGTKCETCPAGTFSATAVSNSTTLPTTKRCVNCPNTRPYSNAGANSSTQCRATP